LSKFVSFENPFLKFHIGRFPEATRHGGWLALYRLTEKMARKSCGSSMARAT